MIFDPHNIKIAMDEHGRLYRPESWRMNEEGNPEPEWVLMEEINFRGEFRRPEW